MAKVSKSSFAEIRIFKNSKKAKQQAIANAQIESDYLIANAKVEGVQETAEENAEETVQEASKESTEKETQENSGENATTEPAGRRGTDGGRHRPRF